MFISHQFKLFFKHINPLLIWSFTIFGTSVNHLNERKYAHFLRIEVINHLIGKRDEMLVNFNVFGIAGAVNLGYFQELLRI